MERVAGLAVVSCKAMCNISTGGAGPVWRESEVEATLMVLEALLVPGGEEGEGKGAFAELRDVAASLEEILRSVEVLLDEEEEVPLAAEVREAAVGRDDLEPL